uniref:Uncharacterized protein n=1 Tax=Poecilia formosa TaxID=48698 RepID=A0A087Y485_POEFO
LKVIICVEQQWKDERISWDPAQFCGITEISVPKSILWRPDLFIYEIFRNERQKQNPYILVSHDGTVFYDEDMRVISTCKMDVHKFPFDTQECSLSIGSAIHCVKEIRIFPFSNSSRATQFSREVMKTQGEWEFLKMSVESANISLYDRRWELLVYKVTIKRRPLLHVINFLLPILFFLILDLASFFIADHRGEKLGFKVTVLLAISVLLLILNDILPSMSNKTPLIATYCIVIFALMLLSLLETILVTYLIDKDSEDELGLCDSGEEKNKQMKTKDCSTDPAKFKLKNKMAAAAATESVKVNNSDHSRDASALLSELKKLQNMMHQHFGPREERVKSVLFCTIIKIYAGLKLKLKQSLRIQLTILYSRDIPIHDVLNYLNLTSSNELYSMTRPVKNYKNPTLVSLEVLLYAILDVIEKDQKFIPYVWTVTRWNNEYISWDPDEFCGIDNVSLPTEILWKPDLTIEEIISDGAAHKMMEKRTIVLEKKAVPATMSLFVCRTEKDKAPPSPYLTINNKGEVEVQNDQVLVSTCRMHIYKFPFDTREIRLQPSDNSSEATEWSREVMRTQYEWLFIDMIVTANNATISTDQDLVIYTITMKRRSLLYIVNFLLPDRRLNLSKYRETGIFFEFSYSRPNYSTTILLTLSWFKNISSIISFYCGFVYNVSSSETGEILPGAQERETEQSFFSYIWIYLRWDNQHIWWDPEQFCGLETEQDKPSPSPYLNIKSHGWVEFRNDQVVISFCKMQVYRFPFDIQSCNISFKSIMHPSEPPHFTGEEIALFYNSNDTEITEESREAMQTQFEWLFLSMTVTNETVNHFGFNQTMIIYTINMKRRSVLYIANFLLPVFFLLCLDFGSFLMSDTGGEKVGFKITLLL